MIQGLPTETPRSFGYDFGSVYFTTDIVNRENLPRLAEVPFFAIEYSDVTYLFQSLNNSSHDDLKNFWLIENKIHGRCFTRPQDTENNVHCTWEYTPENPKGSYKIPASVLEIDREYCYVGNRDGLLSVLNHQGELFYTLQLPSKISSIITSQEKIYIACNDGKIYHLKNQALESIYNARPENNYDYQYIILALCHSKENLVLVDIYGNLTFLDKDYQKQWQLSTSLSHSISLCSDGERIFLGHSKGINCYSCKDGQLLWKHDLTWGVMWQYLTSEELVFGCSDGTISKITPRFQWSTNYVKFSSIAQCQGSSYSGFVNIDTQLIFSCDHYGYFYCFQINGNLILKEYSPFGAILNLKSFNNTLYSTTNKGTIYNFSPKT
ncbi:hypothetical protein GM3709_3577 [Geminocystis sp. NIES-3709]|nr:hypothetical protein GM3709_3577 [Geminocystis sp. NIES-3709]